MKTFSTVAALFALALGSSVSAHAAAVLSIVARHAGNGGGAFFQGGPGSIILSVINTGTATTAAATVTDTLNAAFTIDSASSGCVIAARVVTCTIASGMPGAGTTAVFGISLTVSASATTPISNTATVSGGGGAISAGTSIDSIAISPEPPIVDASFSQLSLSGATDAPPCAVGRSFTATDLLRNTSAAAYSLPYAVVTLSGGNTLLSQSINQATVAAGGTISFTFHIRLATCNVFNLSFSVRSNTNDTPVATPQSVSTLESTAKAITLAGTDTETAPANLTFTASVNPAHGGLTGSPQNPTYTPTAGYFGADSFQFTVTDRGNPDNCGAPTAACAAALTSAAATVSITVSPVNTAPTANAQSVATTTGNTVGVTLTGSDAESPANLSFLVTVNPAHGTLTGTAPNLTYHPTAGYAGLDSFQFTVTDRGKPDNCGAVNSTCAAALTSAAATVSISVNQAPQITSATSVVFAPGKTGQSHTVNTTGFPTGASMVIAETGALPSGVSFTNNNNGTATINGTPAAGTQGSTGSPVTKAYPLTITANNAINPPASQAFTLNITCPTITVNGGNASPWQLVFNTPALGTAFTQTGGNGTIAWTASGLPTNLTMASATGIISGTPNVTGTFSVTVTATDAGGCTGTKALTVALGPSLPTQRYTGVGNTQFFITGVSGAPTTPAITSANTLLLGATPSGSVTVTGATCSAGGALSAVDGTGHFIFTPSVSAATATCTYTASSNTGVGSTGAASTTASLTFTLNNKVWYVSHGSTGGRDGRSNSPFSDMGGGPNNLDCTATTATGDFIYIFQGTGNTTGACALKSGQSLIGSGATLNVPTARPVLTIPGGAGAPTLTGTLSGTGATGLTVDGVSMSTGTSRAVNLVNSDGRFNFRSITTSGAPSGITWNNASAAIGSFTVTGTGTVNTGGIIQNSTGDGVFLANANNVSFADLIVQGSAVSNIRARKVDGLSFNRCTIQNATSHNFLGGDTPSGGDPTQFWVKDLSITNSSLFDGGSVGDISLHNLHIDNLLGTSTIDNSTIREGKGGNLFIRNNTATNYTGAADSLSITNNAIIRDPLQFATNVLYEAFGGGNMSLTINGGTQILGTPTNTMFGVNVVSDGTNAGNGGQLNFAITNATITGNRGGAIVMTANHDSRMTSSITNLTGLSSTAFHVIQVNSGPTATPLSLVRATITGNTLSLGSGAFTGINMEVNNRGKIYALVANNTISGSGQNNAGIVGQSKVDQGFLSLTANNNIINLSNASAPEGIGVLGGTSAQATAAGTALVCLNMFSNSSTTAAGVPGYDLETTTTGFFLAGIVGATNDAGVTSWVNTTKTNTGSVSIVRGTGATFATSGPCPTP